METMNFDEVMNQVATAAENTEATRMSRNQYFYEQANAKTFVITARNGKMGYVAFVAAKQGDITPQVFDAPRIKDENGVEMTNRTHTMRALAKAISDEFKAKKEGTSTAKLVNFYVPRDNAIRAYALLSKIKNNVAVALEGTELENCLKYDGQKYVEATNYIFKALQVAETCGLTFRFHALDDLFVQELDADSAKLWKLAGKTVAFKSGAAQTELGTIKAKYAVSGQRQLMMYNYGGSDKYRALAIRRDPSKSRDMTFKMALGSYYLLLDAMPAVENNALAALNAHLKAATKASA